MHSHKEVVVKIIVSGQAKHEIRDDITPKVMFRLLFGPMRLLIKQWTLCDFAFDLEQEGNELWEAQQRLFVAN